MVGTDNNTERRHEIDRLLAQMRSQMTKMDALRRDLDQAVPKERSPQQARKLIEDIRVPALEVLEDRPAKKPVNANAP
jgi:hypothetical protein